MALFPECTFDVAFPERLVAGRRCPGILTVCAPESIPRTSAIQLRFRTIAWTLADEPRKKRVLFQKTFSFTLGAAKRLADGTRALSFELELPEWLPPGAQGDHCGVSHSVEVRMHVAWAVDPQREFHANVELPPRTGRRRPIHFETPHDLFPGVVLDLWLDSAEIAADQAVEGQLKLRRGHTAAFDGVELALVSVFETRAEPKSARPAQRSHVRIPADVLRVGEPVPIRLWAPTTLPEFTTDELRHFVVLAVAIQRAWSLDAKCHVELEVLPARSTIIGESEPPAVEDTRFRHLQREVAAATGLPPGYPPILVYGEAAPVTFGVRYAPRADSFGLDVGLTFPSVALGLSLRDRRNAYAQRDGAERLARVLVDGLDDATELRMTDTTFAFRVEVGEDAALVSEIARRARAKAQATAVLLCELPFPAEHAHARAAWEAFARAHDTIVVPCGPSSAPFILSALLVTGNERRFVVAVSTVLDADETRTECRIEWRDRPLAPAAQHELEKRLRSRISGLVVTEVTFASATLARVGFTADPAQLVPAAEATIACVLDVCGERPMQSAYRG